MKKLLAILSVVLFANQASADADDIDFLNSTIWSCHGWINEEYPKPFMLRYKPKTHFFLSNTKEAYKMEESVGKEFDGNKRDISVIAYQVKDGLQKTSALVVTRQSRERLELQLINTVVGSVDIPFRGTKKTYCNKI